MDAALIEMAKSRVHLIIEGRVQGVCYRMYSSAEASKLGLAGWVRNLPNGNVELLAEGDGQAINDLVEWCRHGPAYAHVTNVTADYSEADGNLAGFDIRG